MSQKIFKKIIEDAGALGALPFYLFISIFVLIQNELKLFIWLLLGLVFSYFFIVLIRIFYHKDRPVREPYKNLLEKIDASSFPSLHSWRIAMISCLLIYYYMSLYLGIFLFIASIIVMFSRYYLKKHYITDIFFGGLFGIIESVLIILLT